MKKRTGQTRMLLFFFLSIAFILVYSTQVFGQATKITAHQLLKSLNHPKVLILDIRTPGSWQESEYKIKGAVRKNPKGFDSWAGDLPADKWLVLY
jgi:hypothetical protein